MSDGVQCSFCPAGGDVALLSRLKEEKEREGEKKWVTNVQPIRTRRGVRVHVC